MKNEAQTYSKWRQDLYTIIFEAETPKGKLFDILLLWAIIISVLSVCLESVHDLKSQYPYIFSFLEWGFTIIFTLEYILRILCLRKPLRYIFSFYGVVDLIAIIPSFLGLYFTGAHSLVVIRSIRLLRIFRLFKLTRYVGEAEILKQALKSGRQKITVFLLAVLSIALFVGAIMHLIEGSENSFTSIPKGMYWAIVTMTTVGYGDVVPQTDFGRILASFLMIMGYGIIAVPTGIMSVEISKASEEASANSANTRTCPHCLEEGHLEEAIYCWSCGRELT